MAKKIPSFDYEQCQCCNACAKTCPISIISMDERRVRKGCMALYPRIDSELAKTCLGCGMCEKTCPVEAITMVERPSSMLTEADKNPIGPEINPDIPVVIFEERCKGCTACSKVCPAGAIIGTVKNPHKIDQELCVRCGACAEKCKFAAIGNEGEMPPLPEKKAPAPAAAAPKASGDAPAEVSLDKPLMIDPEKCKGCTVCSKVCPAGAISGELKQPHTIDQDACALCGACLEKCKFGAIVNA